MSSKKPHPLIVGRTHDRCPVCGETSYSLSGVHPQCAVRQADAVRMERIKRDRLVEQAAPTISPTVGVKPWQKICPKCKALHHIRQKVCECGWKIL